MSETENQFSPIPRRVKNRRRGKKTKFLSVGCPNIGNKPLLCRIVSIKTNLPRFLLPVYWLAQNC